MANNSNKSNLLPDSVLETFKYEIADEIGVTPVVEQYGWGGTSSRDCGRVGGKIGGNMVKVLVRQAQQSMIREDGLK